MEITYTFRFSDYDALSSACIPNRRRHLVKLAFWLVNLANLLFAVWFARQSSIDAAKPNLLIFVGLLLVWFFGITKLRQMNFRSLNLNGQIIRIALADDCVRSAQDHIDGTMQWSAFTHFSILDRHAFLWINKLQALVIPFDAFKSDAGREEFLAFIAARVKRQD